MARLLRARIAELEAREERRKAAGDALSAALTGLLIHQYHEDGKDPGYTDAVLACSMALREWKAAN